MHRWIKRIIPVQLHIGEEAAILAWIAKDGDPETGWPPGS